MGKVSEWSMTITDCGMNVHIKVGGLEAEETYKRVADVEGTWRPVAHSGMESYLRCLGITGALAEEMMSQTTSEYFTMELLTGGKVKTKPLVSNRSGWTSTPPLSDSHCSQGLAPCSLQGK